MPEAVTDSMNSVTDLTASVWISQPSGSSNFTLLDNMTPPVPTIDEYLMEFQKINVFPLHTNWKYLDMCCNLINEEWPRSITARKHSLTVSCDNFPTSLILVLINKENNEELIIGHCKISPIRQIPSACCIESVIIAKKFRRKGWGRYLMHETEKYIKKKGKSLIYLSTSDKEEFYEKLGYTKCRPISICSDKCSELKHNFVSTCSLPKFMSTAEKNKDMFLHVPSPPPFPKFNCFNSKITTFMHKPLI